MSLNNQNDPTGLAAAITAVVGPLIVVLGTMLGWTTELSTTVTTLVGALVAVAFAVWRILAARKHAYAPTTVDAIRLEKG